mmetsp:Transcript_13615/g.13191  ORF Transcript_13615/g.13191 Transcript_13615/m.13191 type:complete len:286 (-) Transcript_13615:335-1192(-)|eukprot:CAMPEP_0197835110 /NCGR_PEP_ID=MMETSP1437-20131217/24755_1 /TAXON_ID=49252 ORGANISM="Eucampia antarctica, Strain CCMP1452" /NCGR_SAMPLE_ID=MMETSP1437 /ASSEMBLY_ACC=CAM_ASM_001096 /LENGTH=285 /DNA_ID=CAMNT_0043440293 /DNA_START=154 /DNA_END=1011 /DNA_ORIENTATION=-
MKLASTVIFSLVVSSSAFTPSLVINGAGPISSSFSATRLYVSTQNDDSNTAASGLSRRVAMNLLVSSNIGLLLAGTKASHASLLDEYGSDPSKIQNAQAPSRQAVIAQPKSESSMEPNLRSNYYYPTNKKRYLPRIKKCNDAIPDAAEAIGTENWEAVEDFNNKIAEDTVLPMKLYTSSLSGGGTNVKVAFAKDMMKNSETFEKSQKALGKAIKKKDKSASSTALENMATALLSYRTTGKLLGPDGGGDIPSVDEIRRSACRVQGRSFELKVKERDQRLAVAASN